MLIPILLHVVKAENPPPSSKFPTLIARETAKLPGLLDMNKVNAFLEINCGFTKKFIEGEGIST